jgi:hypothetical protein
MWISEIRAEWFDLTARPRTLHHLPVFQPVVQHPQRKPGGSSMSAQPRGLRVLCPQCCGTLLTIPMPTLAEMKGLPGETTVTNLDTLVGRNVVGAILVHCIYACTAVPEVRPLMHEVTVRRSSNAGHQPGDTAVTRAFPPTRIGNNPPLASKSSLRSQG